MEKEKEFLEEEIRLKKVIEIINEKIELAKKNFSDQEHFIIGFKEGMRGTQFTRQALMSMYSTDIYNLMQVVSNPYFGRMDFRKNNSHEAIPIYIGKKMISDKDNKILAYDWRSPVCSMYYDYSVGDAEYQYEGKKIKGKIELKKQLIIENGELLSVEEQETITDDKILLKYLSDSADSRLKSIVATIQKEQNKIIRSPLNNNYIVQGVAGSGKTTVALHRIAYLIYNEAKNINESEFMILGPNKYFLNYISELLPDLDIKNVSQSTFEEIALSIISDKIKIESQNVNLQNILLNKENVDIIKYKSSLNFMFLLEKFIKEYISVCLDQSIYFEGLEICNKEKLQSLKTNISNRRISYSEKINNMIKYLIKVNKENSSELSHQIWLRYRDEYLSLQKNNPRRKEIIDITVELEKEIKKGCPKAIKDYFKFINISPLKLYILFIESLNNEMIQDDNINLEELKQNTLSRLYKKKVNSEDLAPLLLIQYLLKGIKKYECFEHLVIDEAQDLSIAQYYILNKIFPDCTWDIFGDLNQSIYSYQGIADWEQLNKYIFNNKAYILELNKGYRTTAQISEGANLILEYLTSNKSDCVARNGESIEVFDTTDMKDEQYLIKQIHNLLEKNYQTVAIICKDSIESEKLHKKLTNIGMKIDIIKENDDTYSGGLCIVPSYLSKGLEFDGIIIYNANNEKYNSNSLIDMKLLYVSITRALHKLYINYNKTLTKPLEPLQQEKGKTLKRTK